MMWMKIDTQQQNRKKCGLIYKIKKRNIEVMRERREDVDLNGNGRKKTGISTQQNINLGNENVIFYFARSS